MKFTGDSFVKPCDCRSAGECGHNSFAELEALDALVDAFAAEMKKKLRRKAMEGYSGWDNPNWLKDGRISNLKLGTNGKPPTCSKHPRCD